MKIATWNIGEDESKENCKLDISSYEYIVKMINDNDIDVLCLQEAIIKSDYLPSIAEYIKNNSKLKYNIQYELSDSHINSGCRMGVVICSKYNIKDSKLLELENPNITYKVDDNTTYYSHDKGFIISTIKDYRIITGHCLPFHIFKKSPLDYINIYETVDNIFIKEIANNSNTILCGDFNYENVDDLFPKTMKLCKDVVNIETRKDKKLDHIIINNKKDNYNIKVLNTNFDHKLCILDMEV